MSVPRFASMEGPRFTAEGEARYRPYTKQSGRKVRGPWGTAAAGKAWLARATLAKLDGRSLGAGGETISQASERFLAGVEAGSILSNRRVPYAPNTVRDYEYAFRRWVNPELGHIRVNGLRRPQVQRWVDGVALESGAGTTRNAFHALAALYTHLLPRHDDLVDPTTGVQLPRPGKPRERYANPEEMVELLAVLPYDLALPYALAFYAGLRRGEIMALRAEDVDEEWVQVRRSLDPVAGFRLPKNGRPRQIPLFAPLRPYLGLAPAEGLLVPAKAPSKWGARDLSHLADECSRHWEPAGLRRIGLHEGRHSFATALVRAGYDIALVSEWIGHGSPATTLNIYVKPRGREAGLTEKMDTYLGGHA